MDTTLNWYCPAERFSKEKAPLSFEAVVRTTLPCKSSLTGQLFTGCSLLIRLPVMLYCEKIYKGRQDRKNKIITFIFKNITKCLAKKIRLHLKNIY